MEMRTCDYGNANFIIKQINTNVILLNDVDLAQLIQSLTDRIKALEKSALSVDTTWTEAEMDAHHADHLETTCQI
jgi:hypothetical protein